MDEHDDVPLVRFHQLIEGGLPPQRADRSAGGLLPTRAFRFCEPVTTASAFGWYGFLPMAFSLIWDGTSVRWSFDGSDGWLPLGRAQFPHFASSFDAQAPADVHGYSPPFLAALPEPGVVQIWPGLMARTRPGWSLLIRQPANLPKQGPYEMFEGIVETDRWFGPLFTNVRLTKTDIPVLFDTAYPLYQLQPLPRSLYIDEDLGSVEWRTGVGEMSEADWADYRHTVMKDGRGTDAPIGQDAIAVRRRRKRTSTE